MFPGLTPNEPAVLACDRHATNQPPHTDIANLREHKAEFQQTPPMSALLALQDSTSLLVWPGSHVTVWRFMEDERAEADVCKPVRVHLREGEVLIFRGDLVHAGMLASCTLILTSTVTQAILTRTETFGSIATSTNAGLTRAVEFPFHSYGSQMLLAPFSI